MKRKCTFRIGSKDGKRAIYIDDEQRKVILSFIEKDERHRKKFNLIADIILRNLRNTALYDKEDINQKCKDVTAMKFFKGQENYRIYCKEINSSYGVRVVIAAILHQKKNNKNSNKEKTEIEKVGGYEYDI